MFFTGECFLNEFPDLFNRLMTTVPEGQVSPWTMVSSNVGPQKSYETGDYDGYVFESKGSSGLDKIIVGLNRKIDRAHSSYAASFNFGYELFVANEYKPSLEPNTNGVFKGYAMTRFVNYGHPEHGGNNEQTLRLRYWININADRVIIVTDTLYHQATYSRSQIFFLGRPIRYANRHVPVNFIAASSSHPSVSSGGGHIRSTYSSVLDKPRMSMMFEDIIHDNAMANKAWGDLVLPSKLLTTNRGALTGELDILVIPQDGRVRKFDNISVDGKDYLAVEAPYSNSHYYHPAYAFTLYNDFTQDTALKLFLIPKF